ncbi:MAG: M20 family peptidase [Cyclonatronaceae bacterium]
MYRKVAALVVASVLIVLILAVIVLVRTAQVRYDFPDVEPVQMADIPLEQAVDRLSGGLRFRTVSIQGDPYGNRAEFEKFISYVEQAYPLIHQNLHCEKVNELTLLYKWEGSNPGLPAAMMQGHYDVVPVESGTMEEWTYPPFAGMATNGYVWGRGAIDDKSGVFSYLEAVEYLLERNYRPKRNLYIALTHDEEIGGTQGARKVADLMLERGTEIAFLTDEGLPIAEEIMVGIEHPIAMIGVAEKGYISIELSIRKEGGHSSMPPRKTAIGTLSAAITDLEQQPMKGRLTGLLRKTFDPIIPDLPLRYRLALSNLWLFGGLLEDRLGYIPHTNAALRTTVAPTMFHAGVKENVLPQSARATLNFRIHPDDNIQKVLHYVQNTIENDSIGISVLDGFREPSPITSTSSESYQMMKHTIHEVFPGIPVTPSMFPAATATRHFTDLTDNLLRFRPIRARPDDRGRVHGTDERIAVDNYEEMIAFYIRLIQNATRQ